MLPATKSICVFVSSKLKDKHSKHSNDTSENNYVWTESVLCASDSALGSQALIIVVMSLQCIIMFIIVVGCFAERGLPAKIENSEQKNGP